MTIRSERKIKTSADQNNELEVRAVCDRKRKSGKKFLMIINDKIRTAVTQTDINQRVANNTLNNDASRKCCFTFEFGKNRW